MKQIIRLKSIVMIIGLSCFALSVPRRAFAVTPAPDGGYGTHTAEGTNTLYYLDASSSFAIGNTGLGFQALYSCGDGSSNTAVGDNALYYNDNSENTAVGYFSGYHNLGSQNTAVGVYALFTGSDNGGVAHNGSQNTAIGYAALESVDSGSYNAAVGFQALSSLSNGSNNTAMGAVAVE